MAEKLNMIYPRLKVAFEQIFVTYSPETVRKVL